MTRNISEVLPAKLLANVPRQTLGICTNKQSYTTQLNTQLNKPKQLNIMKTKKVTLNQSPVTTLGHEMRWTLYTLPILGWRTGRVDSNLQPLNPESTKRELTLRPKHRERRDQQSQSRRRCCCGSNHVCSPSSPWHISSCKKMTKLRVNSLNITIKLTATAINN